MLLVDDRQRQVGDPHVAFEQRMRAEQQHRLAIRERLRDGAALIGMTARGEAGDAHSRGCRESRASLRVLARQDLRGCHERHAVPLLDYMKGGQ